MIKLMNCLIKLLFNKHLLKYLKSNFQLLNYLRAIGLNLAVFTV